VERKRGWLNYVAEQFVGKWGLDNPPGLTQIFCNFVFALIEDTVRTIGVGHIFRDWLGVF
jgi:hypothetical protein